MAEAEKKPGHIERLLEFLADGDLGIFGAGHLARAIATILLQRGFPRTRLLLCHRGSQATDSALRGSPLFPSVTSALEVSRRSKLLLYLVRPQDSGAIGAYRLRPDCCFVSFMAAVPIAEVPVDPVVADRCRVLTSAPDTLLAGTGIAAAYPSDHSLIAGLIEALGLRLVSLRDESDFHAFTALGVCLPICLAYWESLGREIDDEEVMDRGRRSGLPYYEGLFRWARSVQPRGMSGPEMKEFLTRSATRGGVTEAMLSAITSGRSLSAALDSGLARSRAIADELRR